MLDGQNLVYHEDFGLQMSRHGKRKPHLHPARVSLDRCIEKTFDAGEGDDLVELGAYLGARHA